MTVLDEFESIDRQLKRVLNVMTNDLKNELINGNPILSGLMKGSWKRDPVAVDSYAYVITNSQSYGTFIWYGRYSKNGREYGSKKPGWGFGGGQLVVDRHEFLIQHEFDKIEPKAS